MKKLWVHSLLDAGKLVWYEIQFSRIMRRLSLGMAFQPRDAVFMKLNDFQNRRARIPQRFDLPGMPGNLAGLLDDLPGVFLPLVQQQLHRLCQSFMPPGQTIQALVNAQDSLLECARTVSL
jgi:hypothetical protein